MKIQDTVTEMQELCTEIDDLTEKRLELLARREILMEYIMDFVEDMKNV